MPSCPAHRLRSPRNFVVGIPFEFLASISERMLFAPLPPTFPGFPNPNTHAHVLPIPVSALRDSVTTAWILSVFIFPLPHSKKKAPADAPCSEASVKLSRVSTEVASRLCGWTAAVPIGTPSCFFLASHSSQPFLRFFSITSFQL